METLQLDYPAGTPARRRHLVGVVGSGDLEVLIEPAAAGNVRISIHSSVDGSAALWRALLDRLAASMEMPAAQIQINDFGATPGVVSLRLQQALEAVGETR